MVIILASGKSTDTSSFIHFGIIGIAVMSTGVYSPFFLCRYQAFISAFSIMDFPDPFLRL